MKSLLTAISLSVLTQASVAAPPSDESLRTLFAAMKSDSMADAISVGMESVMRRAMARDGLGKDLTPEQRQVLEKLPQKLAEVFRTELLTEKLEAVHLRIYRDSFTQSEIDGLIDFYRSPVGQSYISKLPLVTQRTMIETQLQMHQLMPKVQSVVQQLVKEVKQAK